MKKLVLSFLISCCLVAISSGQTKQQDNSTAVFIKSVLNHPVKKFSFTDLIGTKLSSDKLKGKVTVINFWFTACKPCILEMPQLNKLVDENKENPVVFIAPAPEDEARINKFLKRYSFKYNIIPSALGYITALKVENFPTHIIIDKEGIVRQVLIGYADDIKEKLQAEIDNLIK